MADKRTGALAVTMARLRRANWPPVPGAPGLSPCRPRSCVMGGRPGKALYQYHAARRRATASSLRWAPRLERQDARPAQGGRKSPTWWPTSRRQGPHDLSVGHRPRRTAARLGVSTAGTVDAALYDAFGQSLAGVTYARSSTSTMWSSTLEKRIWTIARRGCAISMCPGQPAVKQVPLTAVVTIAHAAQTPLSVQAPGAVPGRHHLV